MPNAAANQPAQIPQHFHFDDHCPVCDQEIPADRLEEVQGRIAMRLREQTEELREQHRKERAQADAKAKAQLEDAIRGERDAAAAREQTVRADEQRKRDELLKERLAQAEATRKEQEEALNQRAAAAEARAKSAAATSDGLKIELEQIKHTNAEALDRERKASAEREAVARAAGKIEAEQIAEARVNAAEAALAAAIIETNEKLAQATTANQQLAADWSVKVNEALAAKQAAEQATAALKQNQETLIAERLQEVREAMEKDKSESLLAKDKAQFDERQKWQGIVADLQRKLDKQTSNELGEGAEIKLYDVLKETFPDDRIRRVEKGTPGADIIHEVMSNGKLCGTIVYDSKNRGAWKTEYATKLRQDQITAGADHAVLSTNKFPKEGKELHRTEGVLLVSPARAVVLAEVLRSHIIAMQGLRVSNEERDAKTEQLYTFITSSQCREMIQSIEDLVDKLLKLEADELKAHQKVWATRGGLLKLVLKSNADFRFALANILGGEAEDDEGEEGA
jgi:hypothetical protein